MTGPAGSPAPETLVEVRGVELCVQTFGVPTDPAVLLIMGASGSMDWWEDGFCARLAAGSRFVIRYDNRDTGRSVSYPPGAPGYTFDDLVADAAGVLDALGVPTAHVVGMSMGGAIAQLLALRRPDRVASLTLISTGPASAADWPETGESDPGPDGATDATDTTDMTGGADGADAAGTDPDWTDRAAVIDHLVAEHWTLASPAAEFDEAVIRSLVGRVFDRTRDIESSSKNHWVLDGAEDPDERLSRIAVPTLVLHGTDDPMLPIECAVALATGIPDARLVRLPNTGHEFPRTNWPTVLTEVLGHTAPPG